MNDYASVSTWLDLLAMCGDNGNDSSDKLELASLKTGTPGLIDGQALKQSVQHVTSKTALTQLTSAAGLYDILLGSIDCLDLSASESDWWTTVNHLWHGSNWDNMVSSDSYQFLKTIGVIEGDDEGYRCRLSSNLAVIRRNRFILNALKKWRKEIDGVDPELRASNCILAFCDRNKAVGEFVDKSGYAESEWRLISEMRKLLARALPKHDRPLEPRFSTGAVAEKIGVLARWEAICRNSGEYDYRTLAMAYPSLVESTQLPDYISRVAAVRKTWEKDRIVTIEPFEQIYGQHAARTYIMQCVHMGPLRGTTLDMLAQTSETKRRVPLAEYGTYVPLEWLHKQEEREPFDIQVKHALYALRGSETGSIATLDLTDASDYISWDLVQRVMPAHVLELLGRFRTEMFSTPKMNGSCVPVSRKLHSYAGMGNPTTFVVESLIFWAMCCAVAKISHMGKCFTPSAFGDDIVCDWRLAETLISCEYFTRMGMKINLGKSFHRPASRFRESCGEVAFNGNSIRSIRVYGYTREAADQIALCDLIRRLWTDRDSAVLDLSLRLAEDCAFPNCSYGWPKGTAVTGFSFKGYTESLQTRWNKDLHKLQVKADKLELKTKTVPSDRFSYLLGKLSGSLGRTVERKSKTGSVKHYVRVPDAGDVHLVKRWVDA